MVGFQLKSSNGTGHLVSLCLGLLHDVVYFRPVNLISNGTVYNQYRFIHLEDESQNWNVWVTLDWLWKVPYQNKRCWSKSVEKRLKWLGHTNTLFCGQVWEKGVWSVTYMKQEKRGREAGSLRWRKAGDIEKNTNSYCTILCQKKKK